MKINCPKCNAAVTANHSLQETSVLCHNCQNDIDVVELMSFVGDEVSMTQSKILNKTHGIGDSIAHFRLNKELGEGGFGYVYQAYDSRLDRDVAIKLPRMAAMGERQAKIFIHEAQAAAQLQHSNIVSVFEVGRSNDQVYIVCELIIGTTLKEWTKVEKPNQRQTAIILAKIARALHAAHLGKVIHRDVKPRNILVDDYDEPFITDFGLAKRNDPTEKTITRRGSIMGTPAYMSPEQALGRADEADGRTDVYSAGVMLYEMLVGTRPFRGQTDTITAEIISGGADPPIALKPKVGKDISAICMKAMARKPGDRFDSALEMAEELERFVAGKPVRCRRQGMGEFALTQARRRTVPIVFAAVIIGLIGFLIFREPTAARSNEKVLIKFNVVPAHADVVIAKIDHQLGRVDTENLFYPIFDPKSKKYLIHLEPGDYIVEASMDGFGVQEVRRTVRDDAYQAGGRAHQRVVKLGGGSYFGWPQITIVPTPVSNSLEKIEQSGMEFALIKGGAFDRTSLLRRKGEVELDGFLFGTSEVTVKQFLACMDELPGGMIAEYQKKDIPVQEIPENAIVSHVKFSDVLAYCERTGTRPMLFDEYLFVATNGGETIFPWGNEPLENWESNWGSDSKFKGQNVKKYEQIRGVYTGMMEWTQEYQLATNLGTGQLMQNQNERFVADGPVGLPRLRFLKTSKVDGPRSFASLDPTVGYPYVGFRCARSVQPRFKLKKQNDADKK